MTDELKVKAELEETEEEYQSPCMHTCPVCGNDFFDRANKRYCSRRCYKKAYKLRKAGLLAPRVCKPADPNRRKYRRKHKINLINPIAKPRRLTKKQQKAEWVREYWLGLL